MEADIGGVQYIESDIPASLAKDALMVQNACNLSGVVRSMHLAMEALCAHSRCQGTAWRNHHPIMVLYSATVVYLVTGDAIETDAYRDATRICKCVVENQRISTE